MKRYVKYGYTPVSKNGNPIREYIRHGCPRVDVDPNGILAEGLIPQRVRVTIEPVQEGVQDAKQKTAVDQRSH